MALRDHAIVAYAETKVMEKSDRDVFVLIGEMLESLLDSTGIEKSEVDGLVVAGMTGTGAGNIFWPQTIADVLGMQVGFCEQVNIGAGNGLSSVDATCEEKPTKSKPISSTAVAYRRRSIGDAKYGRSVPTRMTTSAREGRHHVVGEEPHRMVGIGVAHAGMAELECELCDAAHDAVGERLEGA